MTTFYRIADFKNTSFKFELPASIKQIIKHLGDSVTPTDAAVEKKVYPSVVVAKDDWSRARAPKLPPTRIIEVKEGTEKTIKDIRVALNKFSNKNADTQHVAIVQLINQVMTNSENLDEDVKKVMGIIFDIVSTNEFYSALYAKLYKDLMDAFPAFSVKLVDIIENYKDSYNAIVMVDPNADYDGYCAYVKSNDKRKAMTKFIVNSMKNGVMTEESVLDIIVYLEDIVLRLAEDKDKNVVIEEITENIYVFIDENKTTLNKTPKWIEVIVPNVQTISKLRKTDAVKYASMSNRAAFKYMDIIDLLGKK